MTQPDPPEGGGARARVRDLYAGWRYAAIGVLGAVMFGLGLLGFYQSVPGIGFTDAVYASLCLFVFEFNVDGEPSLALDIARFGAAAVVSLTVVIAAFGIVERQLLLARASRLRGHAVVLGNGREAIPLATNLRRSGTAPRVLVISDEVVIGRHDGVVRLDDVSDDELFRVVDHAAQVVVVGRSDDESAALAHRLRTLTAAAPIPTTVMLSDSNLAGHWVGAAPEAVVCRPVRTAIATLFEHPPFLDDAAVPAPIVVGEGPLAVELARRVVAGWQQPGERLRVYCLGADRDWVEEAAVGIEERADLVWVPMRPSVAMAPRVVLDLVRGAAPRDPRFSYAGSRVYVAYPQTSRTVPIAAAIARRVDAVEVTAVVDDAEAWKGTVGADELWMVSGLELLSDPATVGLTVTDLLAGELVADAARWPTDVPGALGAVERPGHGAARLDEQPERVQRAATAVAEQVQPVLAAARIELDAGFPAEVPTLVLSPSELAAIATALGRALPGPASSGRKDESEDRPADGAAPRRDEVRLRRLELAARLPVLAARAGLVPVRRGAQPCPLTDESVRELALEVHHDYLRTAGTTGNATGSTAAQLTWEELSETDRRSSIAQVVDIPVKLAALGLTWRPAADPQPRVFSEAEVELLAELEHRRWVHFQLRNGRARHTFNTSWEGLTDGVQEYDRGPVRLMGRLLASLGYEIVPERSSENV